MPGVLLIEAMAQTAGWLVIAATRFERMPFLAAVKEAKLRTFVTPGQLLSLTADLVHDGSGYAIAAASIASDGKPVCNAELTFKVTEFPSPDFRATMEAWAERLQFPVEARQHG
jgi:3-hydroxyacyl-[acyl-carrier-protein] dehydratase